MTDPEPFRSRRAFLTLGIAGLIGLLGRDELAAVFAPTRAAPQDGPATYTDYVSTLETVTSSTFADLPSPGPAVTVNVRGSGQVIVFVGADSAGTADGALMSFVVSGANIIAASSDNSYVVRGSEGLVRVQSTLSVPLTGLTPGLSTFTAKYATVAGAGAVQRRRLSVLTL